MQEIISWSGVQTSALAFGGRNPAITDIGEKTESWNGTNWTECK
jgi:hypothetical protein